MAKLTIDDLDLSGKRVLVRVDFNVPLSAGQVADDTRIRAACPTLRTILDSGASAIVLSHMGRPKGAVVDALSLKSVVPVLSELAGSAVQFSNDCMGTEARAKASGLKPGELLLLENLRFHKEEELNDPDFASHSSF